MVELAVLNVLVAAEVKTFIFLYPKLEKWEIWDRTRAMTQKLHFFIYTADGDWFFWCYSSNILFYGTKSYPEVQEENPWGCIFLFRLLPFMIPWEKLLSWIVAPLMANDRIRTGIYSSLLLLVWGKRDSAKDLGITGSTQTLHEAQLLQALLPLPVLRMIRKSNKTNRDVFQEISQC